MSSNKGKPGTKGTSKKKSKAPKTSPKAEARANGDCADGLFTCDAYKKGYIRGAGSLSFHQKRLCPVLARKNLFNCDVCGLGVFRGRSSLGLHKRYFCKGVWREEYPETDDTDSEWAVESDRDSFYGRAEADYTDDEENEFHSNFDEARKEHYQHDEYQDDDNCGNANFNDDDDDEEFFKTY